jgi:hypothetical protein
MGQNGGVKKTAKPPKSRPRKAQRQVSRALKWAGGLAVAGLVVYGISQMSGVPYDEVDMGGAVDFSMLNASQKTAALQEANRARCTCGCGMSMAQCVATDRTCPVRDDHIDRIRGMVARAVQQ